MTDTSSTATDTGGGFLFGDRLAGVWGGAVDYQDTLAKLTGTSAIRLVPVDNGPATVLAPLSAPVDVASLQGQLRSTFTEIDEASVYERKASNVVSGSGALEDAEFMLAIRLYANEKWRDQFREWLHDEHLVLQPHTTGVAWVHLYETVDQDDHWHFLNLWGANDQGVYDSAEWAQIRDTDRFFTVQPVFSECRSERQIFKVG